VVFQNNLLMGAAGQSDAAYTIDQSCRFNNDDSAYLYRTPGSSGNRKTWTFSTWLKKCNSQGALLGSGEDHTVNNNYIWIGWHGATNGLSVQCYNTPESFHVQTSALARDPSAWFHVVVAFDTTQSTASNRVKIFINGSQETSLSATTYPSEDEEFQINHTEMQMVGSNYEGPSGGGYYWDGYLAETYLIDGTALTPSSFGETNSTTGQWVPIEVAGLTYGTNGFRFSYEDSSAFGDDTSGEGNDYTSSGLAAADQVTDSPTDNFCTWNTVNRQPASGNTLVLSEGNLELVNGTYETHSILSTHRLHGKQYMEIKLLSSINSAGTSHNIGVVEEGTIIPAANFAYYSDTFSGMLFPFLVSYSDGVADPAEPDYGTLANGDTLGFAISEDDGKFWCRIDDGDWLGGGDPETTSSTPTGTFSNITIGQWIDTVHGPTDKNTSDFGQLGYAYTAPSGYETVSSANLDDPTIADPSGSFQTTLYTGDGSTQSIDQGGNSTFEPDLVWIKNRDAADNHCWFDSVRGATKLLSSNNTDAESTDADTLTAFDSDGFSLGDDDKVNTDTEKYVGWQWLESATPGCDIVIDTGTGSAHTISHSLGVTPELIIRKDRTATADPGWIIWHTSLPGANYYLNFDTGAEDTSVNYWNNTLPTSSVFSVGASNGTNQNTKTFVTYLFAGVEGFSKFGKYTGNASADGPFVWCGFRPAVVIIKNTSAENWAIHDTQRSPYNVVVARLEPSANDAEATNLTVLDFLSNGFKIRGTDTMWNGDGTGYVYMAWAETPFKTATAR